MCSHELVSHNWTKDGHTPTNCCVDTRGGYIYTAPVILSTPCVNLPGLLVPQPSGHGQILLTGHRVEYLTLCDKYSHVTDKMCKENPVSVSLSVHLSRKVASLSFVLSSKQLTFFYFFQLAISSSPNICIILQKRLHPDLTDQQCEMFSFMFINSLLCLLNSCMSCVVDFLDINTACQNYFQFTAFAFFFTFFKKKKIFFLVVSLSFSLSPALCVGSFACVHMSGTSFRGRRCIFEDSPSSKSIPSAAIYSCSRSFSLIIFIWVSNQYDNKSITILLRISL